VHAGDSFPGPAQDHAGGVMTEWMTEEEVRQRSGQAFFEPRMERLLALVGRVMSTAGDEVWVSAYDDGSDAVRGGHVLGMPVIVSRVVRAGNLFLWSDSEKRFLL
jgi:hypothetical protein